nr:hypothetical protein C50F7.7 - Caenorhabditis elegans [Caenorhabditis elegans]
MVDQMVEDLRMALQMVEDLRMGPLVPEMVGQMVDDLRMALQMVEDLRMGPLVPEMVGQMVEDLRMDLQVLVMVVQMETVHLMGLQYLEMARWMAEEQLMSAGLDQRTMR